MSYSTCCVADCDTKPSANLTNVTFYRMPADETLKSLWMLKMFGVVDNKFKDAFVCSAHFKEDDFEQDSKSIKYRLATNTILKHNAIPSVKLGPQKGNVTVVKTTMNKEQLSASPLGVVIYKYEARNNKNTHQQKLKERIEERLKQKINILKAELKSEKEKCLILQRKMAELKNKVNELDNITSDAVEASLEKKMHQIFNGLLSKSQLDNILKNQNLQLDKICISNSITLS